MSIITLTTDFGLKDHFVGSLKGKILIQNPDIQIIDISHDIDLFNIAEAGYVINASYNNFPKGTVHVIGVDSERNLDTKHIALQWNDHFFVCADNGILSILTQKIKPQKAVEISIYDEILPQKTALDIFIEVACQLAKGSDIYDFGQAVETIKVVNELQPVVASERNQIKGYVVYIDHFGNCITNISKELVDELAQDRPFEVKFGTKTIKRIHQNYSDFNIRENYTLKDYEGEKLALFNEAGFLEIAIYKSNPNTVGSAHSLLGLKYRDLVTIEFK